MTRVRVHHLNCATMCPPLAGLLIPHGHLVAHVLVIEAPDGLLLVDTGLGTRDIETPRTRLGLGFLLATGPALSMAETVSAQLGRLGARPADVRNIVVTHLDLDHAGGLSDFPEATVHVVAREHALAISRQPLRHRARYRAPQFAHAPRWRDYAPGGERWFGFEGVREVEAVGADVLLVPLVGHTLGHTGVAVRSGDRWRLHAGDAYFHHNEVLGKPAPRTLEYFQRAMAMDGQQRVANRDRLAELARQGTVDVFCAHDPDELSAMTAHAA